MLASARKRSGRAIPTARQRNSSLLVSARQLQALVRRRSCDERLAEPASFPDLPPRPMASFGPPTDCLFEDPPIVSSMAFSISARRLEER